MINFGQIIKISQVLNLKICKIKSDFPIIADAMQEEVTDYKTAESRLTSLKNVD